MTIRREWDKVERWSAIACVLVAVVLFYGPYLLRVDLFFDDAAQHIFWLYRYADPALFPDDISVKYFMTSAPWGYRALYSMVAPVMDVLQAAEWLAVVLLFVSALLAWKAAAAASEMGRELHGLLAVVAMIVLLPLSVAQDLLPPIAFQRTFALPLTLLTLWGLVSRRYAWVGVSWLTAALVYPVVLPVQGLTAAVVFLRDLVRERRMPSHWVLNGVLGLAALIIAAVGIPIPPEIGPAFTYEQAIRMPEFGPNGRLGLYQSGVVGNLVRGHMTGLGWTPGVLLLMAVSMGLAGRLGRIRSIPFAAWAMACVGVGLWAAMRLFPEQLMFGLYLPNRHSRWAIGVFGLLAMAAGAGALLERAGKRWAEESPGSEWYLRRWIAVAAPLVVAAVLMPNAVRLWQQPVNTDLENAYAFISTLPKSTLVAAHPDLADFVPVRTRRSVLTSTEISMPWMQGYYAHMKPRIEASLRAAYATRIEDLDAALGPFGVDVMLTGPSVWQSRGYFVPFDGLARALLARGSREGFALKDPPADRVLFRSGEYFVVRVAK